MRRRTFSFLLGTLVVAGCARSSGPYPGRAPVLNPSPATGPATPVGHVAILLPMSGPDAARGQILLQAAQLALAAPGAPALDVRDTGGTPAGAASAAQAAVQAGDSMILGPLTATETAAAATPARQAGVPVLAFTSDPTEAQPGVWVLGLTPNQQVNRLVQAAQAQGKTRFAALLPQTELGRAMGRALSDAVPAATIRTYSGGMGALNVAVRALSDYANRRGPIDAKIREARKRDDAEGRREARELARTAIPPAPFDALLLADTGVHLAEIGSLLPYYDIGTSTVRIMGPALWASPAARAGSGGTLNGAWFAAPDPASRGDYEQRFQAKYGSPPPPLSDLAYDAASIARVMATEGGVSPAALTRPSGFTGADGVLALEPDGRVRRGLAVFEIQRGGPTVVDPAPQTLTGT